MQELLAAGLGLSAPDLYVVGLVFLGIALAAAVDRHDQHLAARHGQARQVPAAYVPGALGQPVGPGGQR